VGQGHGRPVRHLDREQQERAEHPGGRQAPPPQAGLRPTALLALDQVSLAFGSLLVLDRLGLSVGEGEAVGVIGPNGAGKTTALNVLAGRLRPDRGRVLFEGRDITALPPHRRTRAGIALTHQIPHPFTAMTVFENVLVGATHGAGRPERAAAPICRDALDLAGLAGRENARAGALTLVERKRLELARALATGPRVLLLDEIAGGLAEPEIVAMIGVIRRVRERGVAIIWIEHVVHALRAAVDRLVAINFGAAVMDGPPDAVMASPEVRRIYLGIDVA
jgi:branched-chain amino acid transport system ATP-binding protein